MNEKRRKNGFSSILLSTTFFQLAGRNDDLSYPPDCTKVPKLNGLHHDEHQNKRMYSMYHVKDGEMTRVKTSRTRCEKFVKRITYFQKEGCCPLLHPPILKNT